MVPVDLKDFIVASLGASASFIGLLFVGLSVVLQKIGDKKLADTDRILAESSYASLINIFFVSLVATLPDPGIGYVCLVMSILGLLSCWRLRHFSHFVSILVSTVVFGIEFIFSIGLIHHPNNYLNVSWFEFIIIALFATSLIRAWGLTGIHTRDKAK